MKKTGLLFISIILLSFAFSFSAFANEDSVGQIKVISGAETVKVYDIVTNNTSLNARDTIEKAVRYAKANATENNIYTVSLPKGEYAFYSSLNLYSNTVLDLGGSVIYRKGSCASLVRFGSKESVSYGYEGFKNITVKNGTFDACYTGKSSLFRFAHAYNVVLDNLVFKSTRDVRHMLTFAACNGVKVTNCRFLNMQISESLESSNCEALQIDTLKEGNFDYPAYDGTPTKNVTVSGCEFNNVPRGVGTHSVYADQYFDNIKITANTFYNIKGYAINATNYKNSLISNNVISKCSAGINCSTVTNEKLTHFYAPVKESDLKADELNTEISQNNITIFDNGFKNNSYGIKLFGANVKNFTDNDGKAINGDFRISGVSVLNNTITVKTTETNTNAIDISGALGSAYGKESNIQILKNKITFSSSSSKVNYAIKTELSENVYIKGNTATDLNSDKPVMVSAVTVNNSSAVSVVSNNISNTASFGIKLTDVKKGTASYNTVKNSLSNGIYVFSNCNSFNVSYNKIYNCKGYGIAIRDANVKSVKGNSVYSSKKCGIYITENAVVSAVTSNYVCDSKGHGIYLNKNAKVSYISKNTIDIASKKLDAIGVFDKALVEKVNSNKINLKQKENSKKLKVKCRYGINIQNKKSGTKEIKTNKIKKCNRACVNILSENKRVKIYNNTFSNAPYAVRYVNGKLKNNTYEKCTKAKYIKL